MWIIHPLLLAAPVVTIPEADDGLVSGEEAADGVQLEIELPEGVGAGIGSQLPLPNLMAQP